MFSVSRIDIKGCVEIIRAQEQDVADKHMNILRYTTKHLNDEKTPKDIKDLIMEKTKTKEDFAIQHSQWREKKEGNVIALLTMGIRQLLTDSSWRVDSSVANYTFLLTNWAKIEFWIKFSNFETIFGSFSKLGLKNR